VICGRLSGGRACYTLAPGSGGAATQQAVRVLDGDRARVYLAIRRRRRVARRPRGIHTYEQQPSAQRGGPVREKRLP
jgi:hypothetical protein